MQTKLMTIGVLVVSATALGGVYLWTAGNEVAPSDPQVTALYAKAQEQDFRTPVYEPIEVEEIEQRAPSSSLQGGTRNGRFDFAARMTEFDLDGDGVLSKEERDAMRQAFRAERIARFDLDGDGELSREERQAARMARFENSDRGQALMRQFDADGDGELNADEQAAMDAYLEEQGQDRRAAEIAKYDLDGDGELSEDERVYQQEERQAQRDNFMQDMTQEFDLDGDGQLSIEEQQDAFNTMRERREIDRFVEQFDFDGDGQMGAGDYSSFAADYGNGDLGADVNGDGVVNTQDLADYRDMVTRSGNRP